MDVMGNGDGEGDDAVEDLLRRFYEECPEPSAEDVERWRGLNPEHGEAIAAFAAEARRANAVLSAGVVIGPERAAKLALRADELTRRLIEQDRLRRGGVPSAPTAE